MTQVGRFNPFANLDPRAIGAALLEENRKLNRSYRQLLGDGTDLADALDILDPNPCVVRSVN